MKQKSIDQVPKVSNDYFKQSVEDSDCDEAIFSSARHTRKLNSQGMNVTQSVGLQKVPKISQHNRDRSEKSDSAPGSKKMSRVQSTEIETGG